MTEGLLFHSVSAGLAVLVKIIAERQVAVPPHVLSGLCAKPGEHLWIEQGADGALPRIRRVAHARLAPLHAKIRPGRGTVDQGTFRDQPRATGLRD